MSRPLVLAVAASVAAWVPPVVFGLRWPGYSPSRDFISELGAAGAPDAAAVNLTFLVAGLLFVATCAAIARATRDSTTAMMLASLVGWSYVVVAFAPCDAGCPADGSSTQAFHNAVGALGYLGGGLGVLLASRASASGRHAPPWLSAAAGLLALGGLVAMGAPELADVRGAAQRVVEGGVFVWLLVEARRANPIGSPHASSAVTPPSLR